MLYSVKVMYRFHCFTNLPYCCVFLVTTTEVIPPEPLWIQQGVYSVANDTCKPVPIIE